MEYEELLRYLHEDEALLEEAYAKFLESPTAENHREVELLAGNVADDKWDLQRYYPGRSIDLPSFKLSMGGASC